MTSSIKADLRGPFVNHAALAIYVLCMIGCALLVWSAHGDIALEEEALTTARDRLTALQSRRMASPAAAEDYGLRAADQFLTGDRLTVAAAELQRRVASEITRLGGGVVSSRIERAAGPEPARDIQLAVEFDLAQAELEKLLYALEASTPFIFVEKLSLRSRGETSEADAQPRLRIALLVSGAWREYKP